MAVRGDSGDAQVSAEDPRDDTLRAAWTDYVRALGDEVGWAAIASIAPLPAAADAWVRAWARAVSNVGARAHIDEELQIIEEHLLLDGADVRALLLRRKELLSMQKNGLAVDVPTVRGLLRLCTGRFEADGHVRRVVLNPHHPLVLRLRLVGDNILATTLKQLWTGGWAGDAFKQCNEGAHKEYAGDLQGLINDTEKLAERLQEL